MLEQQGQVVEVSDGSLTVRLGGRSGCAACDAGKGCGAGVFGRLLKRRPVLLRFKNHLGARCGQAVIVGVPEPWFLQLVARFYLFPLLAGLGGAAFGHYLTVKMQTGAAARDVIALACALIAGGVAFRWAGPRSREFPGGAAVHLLRIVDDSRTEPGEFQT